ncbi:MAG TPA: hypothetical protein VFS50_12085 [Meiothermus sp.]|nr:hypothetical protein [Meiothermus sp.]
MQTRIAKTPLYIALTALTLSLGVLVAPPTALAQANQTAQAVAFPINLNTASDAEILSVPGVGSRMLREFKEYRPYVNIEQFERELGKYVDQAQVQQWEQYVFVPTNPNTATAYQLMALKGVDKAMADYIIAGRSYKDWATLKAALLKKYEAKTVDALQRYWIF